MTSSQPLVRLLAKTNRAGFFHSAVSDNIVVHVDSSANSAGHRGRRALSCVSTGWVAHNRTHGEMLAYDQPFSAGGSVEFMDLPETNHFEFYGAVRALRDIIPQMRATGVQNPRITLKMDNKAAMWAIKRFLSTGQYLGVKGNLTHRKYWREFVQLSKQAIISVSWEKGHDSRNVANGTADRIALRLRKSAECFGTLTPLQTYTDVYRVIRRKLPGGCSDAFAQQFFSDSAFATAANVENAALITLDQKDSDRIFKWSLIKNGNTVLNGVVENKHVGVSLSRSRALADVMLAYRTSPYFEAQSTVYVGGLAADSLVHDLLRFCNSNEGSEGAVRYNLETVMLGVNVFALSPNPSTLKAHAQVMARVKSQSHTSMAY